MDSMSVSGCMRWILWAAIVIGCARSVESLHGGGRRQASELADSDPNSFWLCPHQLNDLREVTGPH